MSAARATTIDIQVMETLDKMLGVSLNQEDRDKLYLKILNAKIDISSLSPMEILQKDLKLINGIIAIPGFPILVEV